MASQDVKYSMRNYDVEKISMNLSFLEMNTINTDILIGKLIEFELLGEEDRLRISHLPNYRHNMELYLTVIRRGPTAFDILLNCLSETGNFFVLERLSPQTDFHVIFLACKQNWPFTCLMVISHTFGILYWLYKLHLICCSSD